MGADCWCTIAIQSGRDGLEHDGPLFFQPYSAWQKVSCTSAAQACNTLRWRDERGLYMVSTHVVRRRLGMALVQRSTFARSIVRSRATSITITWRGLGFNPHRVQGGLAKGESCRLTTARSARGEAHWQLGTGMNCLTKAGVERGGVGAMSPSRRGHLQSLHRSKLHKWRSQTA